MSSHQEQFNQATRVTASMGNFYWSLKDHTIYNEREALLLAVAPWTATVPVHLSDSRTFLFHVFVFHVTVNIRKCFIDKSGDAQVDLFIYFGLSVRNWKFWSLFSRTTQWTISG